MISSSAWACVYFFAFVSASFLSATELDLVEQRERQIDRAALASQDLAIRSLEALAKKQAGGERELIFLTRVVEAHQQAAKIQFRLSHADSVDDGVNKSIPKEYQRREETVIAAATQFIVKFPDEDGAEPIYFARAEAYRELGQKTPAEKDYELITARFPRSPWAERANLALGALAVEAGDYGKAIVFLKKVESILSEQYPFVLYQIAWAHFNLNDIPKAIDHLKRRNDFYRHKKANLESKKLSAPDRALQEQGLKDIVAFYFSRYDKGDQDFTLSEALPAFRNAQPGSILGKMLLHMSTLLKSRDRLEGLEQWTGLVIESEPLIPEAAEVAVVLLEYTTDKNLFDRGAVDQLRKLYSKVGRELRGYPSYPRALNVILQGAASLQSQIAKEVIPADLTHLRRTLLNAYDAFVYFADDTHPSLVSTRHNRAELLWVEEAYISAANEYRWLVQHCDNTPPLNRPFYSHKAVVADFRELLKQGHIPQDLAPGKLEGETAPNMQTLPPSVGDWVGQVNSHLAQYGRQPEDFGAFEYEAYRLLYALGQSRAAIVGMGRLAQGSPRAPVAMPAAKFALDTYLKNADWKAARELGFKLAQIPELGNDVFRRRLADMAAETSLRAMEQAVDANDFQVAAVLSQEFMLQYGATTWAPQGLLMSSRVALAKGDARESLQLLDDLIARFPNADNLVSALLLRAGFAESEYNFDGAASDLKRSLTLIGHDPKTDSWPPIARRFFLANWLSSHPQPIDCASYGINESIRLECERHQGLVLLTPEGGKINRTVAVEHAQKGNDENRAIWSAVALNRFGAELAMKDRLEAAVLLADRWKQLDPLIQFTLIATLNRTLPEMFRISRQALPTLAPLKANTKSLVKRIGLIRDIETSVERIVDLPWAQIKVSLLATVAQLYLDFVVELTKLPPPKNLSASEKTQYEASVAEILTPFRAKGEAISKQVKTLAAKTAVNPEALIDFKVEPSRKLAAIAETELGLLKSLLQDIRPPLKASDNPSRQEKLASLWAEAFQAGTWPRTAFLFQELKTKFSLRDSTLAALRALALSRAGAKAEAIAELEAATPSLGEPQKQLAKKLATEWYQSSTASELAPSQVSAGISGGSRR